MEKILIDFIVNIKEKIKIYFFIIIFIEQHKTRVLFFIVNTFIKKLMVESSTHA